MKKQRSPQKLSVVSVETAASAVVAAEMGMKEFTVFGTGYRDQEEDGPGFGGPLGALNHVDPVTGWDAATLCFIAGTYARAVYAKQDLRRALRSAIKWVSQQHRTSNRGVGDAQVAVSSPDAVASKCLLHVWGLFGSRIAINGIWNVARLADLGLAMEAPHVRSILRMTDKAPEWFHKLGWTPGSFATELAKRVEMAGVA